MIVGNRFARFAPWVMAFLGFGVVIPSIYWLVSTEKYQVKYEQIATQEARSEARALFYQECQSDGLTRQELISCFAESIAAAREPERAEADLRAQREMAEWAKSMLIVSFFTFVVSAIGIFLVGMTFKAAVESNRLNRQTLAAQQRPWVEVTIGLGGPLIWNVNGLNLNFVVKLKNTGSSPALRYYVRLRAFSDFDVNIMTEKLSGILDAEKESERPWGNNLFPGEISIQEFGTTISREAIKEGCSRHGMESNFASPFIVGLVKYWSSFDDDPHHTSFIYKIYRSVIVNNSLAIAEDMGDVPIEHLSIRRWISDGVAD